MKVGLIAGALAAVLGLVSVTQADARHRVRSHQTHYVVRYYEPPINRIRAYTGLLPSCADEGVHGQIANAFASREREYWGSGLALTAFTRPRELGYRTWGANFIPRRFCAARTVTTDGRRRDVYWLIAEDQGTFSIGPGLDWCVTGLDRNYAFAPNCKMARP